jgi:hypothetical protein
VVKTADVEMSAGAGSIAIMSDNMDPGLKPYMLNVSTDISAIYNSVNNSVSAIDKMANTGAVRATESRTLSGVAMRTEFELLNAKISEIADNLELAEEQMWRYYCLYQGVEWTGMIDYPDSFNIQDVESDIAKLKVAKETATDTRVIELIDRQLVTLLGEDPDTVMMDEDTVFEPHVMLDPNTGEKQIAETMEQHLDLQSRGWIHIED